MLNKKLIVNNRNIAIFSTLIIFIFTICTLLLPLLFLKLIPQSGVSDFALKHIYLGYLFFPFLIYIIFVGVYQFRIKIDAYIVNIVSFRVITGVFRPSNYIDISHAMLFDFKIFNRPLSFNKTLMIKIKKDNDKIIVRRFNLSFLSKSDEIRINKVLGSILDKKLYERK